MNTRRLVSLALLFTACDVDPASTSDAAFVDGQAPAPVPFTLSVPPMVTGTTATIEVSGAPAGLTVTLVVSGNVTGPGLCPPQLAPTCTDVANPLFTLGTAVTDPAGNATFTINVPGNAPAAVEFQAYGSQRRVFYLSNGVLADVYQGADDFDGDGLSNADEFNGVTSLTDPDTDDDGLDDGAELQAGTDPLLPDTDGGGELDGDEVAAGRDPLDPTDDGGAPPAGHLVINEIDYDQPSADTLEFVEIYNPTASDLDLTGVALVFVNGSNSTEYLRVDLGAAAASLPAGGYLVVSNAAVAVPSGVLQLFVNDSSMQNGSPDAVALVDTTTGTVLDALSYEGEITAGVINGLPAPVNLVEGTATTLSDIGAESLARVPNGQDTDDAATDWAVSLTPTPGSANL